MKSRDRIFREVTAAIIGSKLRASELRELADLLGRPSFSHELARIVYELSMRFDSHEGLLLDEYELNELASGGVAELVYAAIQRKRLPKAKVLDSIRMVWPNFRKKVSASTPVRVFLDQFFATASVAQQQRLMDALGVELPDDPYLAEVSSRSK